MPESQTPPQLRLRPVLLVLVCAVVLLTLTQRTGWLSRPYAWVHDGLYAPLRTALHARCNGRGTAGKSSRRSRTNTRCSCNSSRRIRNCARRCSCSVIFRRRTAACAC